MFYVQAAPHSGLRYPSMKQHLVSEKTFGLKNWAWRKRMEHRYSEHAGLLGDGQQLQFLFGIGEGVSHLARMVALSGNTIRLFSNPLGRFDPPVIFSQGPDRLAIGFQKDLESDHPLLRVYRMLVEYDNDWVVQALSNRVVSDEPETLHCLVKSTQGLLATEAILRQMKCRAVLYIGDPVKTVDTLFRIDDASSNLDSEARSVLAPLFLSRFLRRDYQRVMRTYSGIRKLSDERTRSAALRVLVVGLIQHMFRMLAARYPGQVKLARYEDLIRDPYQLFGLLEHLFGETGLAITTSMIASSTFKPDGKQDLMWKDAWPESSQWSGSLSAKQIRHCYQVLEESGLGGSFMKNNMISRPLAAVPERRTA